MHKVTACSLKVQNMGYLAELRCPHLPQAPHLQDGWLVQPSLMWGAVTPWEPVGPNWSQLVPAQISRRCSAWGPVLALLCDRSACWDLANPPHLCVQSSNAITLTSWGCGILWGMTELTRAKCLT